MSRRCPECRFVNEDSRIFCASCGATLDPRLRLIQDLEKKPEPKETLPKRQHEINFYGTGKRTPPPKKKSSPLPWILLLLAAAAVILWLCIR